MKYIVTEHHGLEEMFIFPETINHDDMMEVLSRIKTPTDGGGWERIRRTPVRAGFISEEGGECYGRSETLRLGSRMDVDTRLFKVGGYDYNLAGVKRR